MSMQLLYLLVPLAPLLAAIVVGLFGLWFGLGVGIGFHNGWTDATSLDHKALGSRALLHFPFEIGYRFDQHHSLSVYFEHFSNGYTRKYNEGIDGLGLRYGYRF